MKNRLLSLHLAGLLLLAHALQAQQPVSTLLVIPSRLRMVQLAFDMQSLRQAEVVSWRVTEKGAPPELFHWTGSDWKTITLDAFRSVSFLPNKPQKVIFLGLDTPESLADSTDLPGVARFETFDAAVLVNNLDAFYAFSEDEWRLLSKRYGFVLRDVNAKAREQNRYARPAPDPATSKRPAPVKFEKAPPPAEVIEPAAAPAPELVPEKANVAPEPVPEKVPDAALVKDVSSAPVKAEAAPADAAPAP